MTRRTLQRRNRRGAALLIVLAALMLVTVAATIVAQTAGATVARRDADRALVIADDLADAALAPIRAWLAQVSPTCALPADADSPMFSILDVELPSIDAAGLADSLALSQIGSEDSGARRLRITAWDQRGMVPWNIAARRSGLATILPADVRDLVASTRIPANAPLGLDLVPASGARAILPSASAAAATGVDAPQSASARQPRSRMRPALGELVATHGVPPGGNAATSTLFLNVNTAPRALLEAAAEAAQTTLPDALWQRRSTGKPYQGALPNKGSAGASEPIAFTTTSDCWSIRIDASVGHTRRSWWLVMQRSDRGEWVVAQRFPIVTEPRE